MPIEKPSSADSAPFGGKGFGAADHDAVGHDKRDENPQRLIEAEGIGVDQHLHDAHHRGDNHYVDGDRISAGVQRRRLEMVRLVGVLTGWWPNPAEGVGGSRGDRQQRDTHT